MKSLHPARDELEARRKREAIELCGKNRGPHDYMAIEWLIVQGEDNRKIKRITRLLCRICFCNVNVSTLIATYRDISDGEKHDIFP